MRTICRSPRWPVPAILTLALGLIAGGCGEPKPTEQTAPSTTPAEEARDLQATTGKRSTEGALSASQPPEKEAAEPVEARGTPEVEEPGSPPRWLRLDGETGSSSQWGSGWLDLATPTDFAKGTRLRVRVGGTAKKIYVRLLAKGVSPDSSRGIVGGAVTVPENRVVEVRLDVDRKGIKQISVHGGPNPWNKQLGPTNGPATLEAVEVMKGE